MGTITKFQRVAFRVVGSPVEAASKISESGIIEGRDTILVESESVFQSCVGTYLESQFHGLLDVSLTRHGLSSDVESPQGRGTHKWKAAPSVALSIKVLPRWIGKEKVLLSISGSDGALLNDDDETLVGYAKEKDDAMKICKSFISNSTPATLVITGSEGMGKTNFANMVKRWFEKHPISIW